MVLLASNLFSDAGSLWLLASSVVLGSAALLAITLAAVRVASRLTQQLSRQSRVGAVTIGVAVVTSMLVILTTGSLGGVASKLAGVAPLLLIAVYVIAAEANSRLPGRSEVTVALRVWMPTLAVVVVLTPLSYYEFDAVSLWPVAVGATTVAVAALVAFRLLPRGRIQLPAP
jgi:hypothetical protein